MLKDKVAIQYHPRDLAAQFTPHPNLLGFLEKDQSCHLPPSKMGFVTSQSPKEPWF